MEILFRLSISITFIGILFKITHWPQAFTLLVVGLSSIIFFYSAKFYFLEKKNTLDYIKLPLVISFIIQYAFGIFHWPYRLLFTGILILSLVAFAFVYIKEILFSKAEHEEQLINPNKDKKKTIQYLMYSIVSMGILIGALFKIMHWPYGNVLLILGLIGIAVIVLVDSR